MRIHKQYASLPDFLANPDPQLMNENLDNATTKKDHRSKHKLKVEQQRQAKMEDCLEHLCNHYFLDAAIDVAEDDQTRMTKEDANNPKKMTINTTHSRPMKAAPGFTQKGINMGLSI